MFTLYIFNSDHDLALANNDINYMPRQIITQMKSDLALLPMWLTAGKDVKVLASSAYNLDFLNNIKAVLPIQAELLTPRELSDCSCDVLPWGWNKTIKHFLLKNGVAPLNAPTDDELLLYRDYSHRFYAVSLLKELQLDSHCCGKSIALCTLDACRQFVETHTRSLLKAPYSSSGKGLNWCNNSFSPSVAGWCDRLITHDGGVVGEEIQDKIVDFAMEFKMSSDGAIDFEGYSLFFTSKSGNYEGNELLSDEAIENRLSCYLPSEVLHQIQAKLIEILPIHYKGYAGYLGVDMMICQHSEAPFYRLHPCVEVNLRLNMGLLTSKFHRHFMQPDGCGKYYLNYYGKDKMAQEAQQNYQRHYPLIVEQGRVVSGYLPLTPVTSKTRYSAFVLVE